MMYLNQLYTEDIKNIKIKINSNGIKKMFIRAEDYRAAWFFYFLKSQFLKQT
jgi:hypothetical protein